jgi:MFS family permease
MDGAAGTGRKVYTLALLTMASMLSIMDRALTSVLQEPIRHEFHLNDTQLGLFSGLIFAIPYAAITLPFGVIADRVNRARLYAACFGVFSVMIGVCGLVASFPLLLLARVFVALAAGAGAPSVQSIVADLFSDKRRATAMGFYYMGIPLGALVSMAVLAGIVAPHYGWRSTFLSVAVPGLVLSLLMFLTMRAPPRGSAAAPAHPAPPLGEVLGCVWRQRSLFYIIVGMALGQMAGNAIGIWTTSYFVRYHHLTVAQVGLVLGPLGGLVGVVGMMASGLLTDRVARNDPRRALWVIIGSMALVPVMMVLTFSMTRTAFAFGVYAVYLFVSYLWMPPIIAAAQGLAGPSRRGTIAALSLLTITLVGSGLGPQLAGVVSDLLKPYAGPESLRWSLFVFSLMALLGAGLVLLARRTYLADLQRATEAPSVLAAPPQGEAVPAPDGLTA